MSDHSNICSFQHLSHPKHRIDHQSAVSYSLNQWTSNSIEIAISESGKYPPMCKIYLNSFHIKLLFGANHFMKLKNYCVS